MSDESDENLSNKDVISHPYQTYNYPELIDHINLNLESKGYLECDPNSNYCYLKIDNQFIYDSFSFLQDKLENPALQIPDYFSPEKNAIGAHITLVYPEEKNSGQVQDFVQSIKSNRFFQFEANELISMKIFNKTIFALTVDCKELYEIRKNYGLPQKLNYHGLQVPLHITVAVIVRSEKG